MPDLKNEVSQENKTSLQNLVSDILILNLLVDVYNITVSLQKNMWKLPIFKRFLSEYRRDINRILKYCNKYVT